MNGELNYKEMWLRLREQLERDWDLGYKIKSGRALSLMDEFEKADWAKKLENGEK